MFLSIIFAQIMLLLGTVFEVQIFTAGLFVEHRNKAAILAKRRQENEKFQKPIQVVDNPFDLDTDRNAGCGGCGNFMRVFAGRNNKNNKKAIPNNINKATPPRKALSMEHKLMLRPKDKKIEDEDNSANNLLTATTTASGPAFVDEEGDTQVMLREVSEHDQSLASAYSNPDMVKLVERDEKSLPAHRWVNASFKKRFSVNKSLGSGASAEVALCRHKDDENVVSAVKRFFTPSGAYTTWGAYTDALDSRYRGFGTFAGGILNGMTEIQRELKWARLISATRDAQPAAAYFMDVIATNVPELKNPSQRAVVAGFDSLKTMKKKPSESDVLWVEVNNGGKALVELATTQAHNNGASAARTILQLAEALEYMRTNGIIHHDLKGRNVVYNFELKKVNIIDFGAMMSVGDCPSTFVHSFGFSPYECTNDKCPCGYDPHHPHGYDTFSMGGTISELILGKNIVWNYARLPMYEGAMETVQWKRMMEDFSTDDKFISKCANISRPGAKVFREVEEIAPGFLNVFRHMFAAQPSERTTPQEFLHVLKRASDRIDAAWNKKEGVNKAAAAKEEDAQVWNAVSHPSREFQM